jgi:ribosome maturation factor RimP
VAGSNELEAALAPICASVGAELFDCELDGHTLQITVERSEPLDLDLIAEITRRISGFLDEHDGLAPTGRYALEVSSPGLERRLRRPEHFSRAIGETVSIRTLPGGEGPRRMEGAIISVDEGGVALTVDGAPRYVRFDEVERAKTVFDWYEALRADARGGDETDGRAEKKMTTKAREAGR